MFVIYSIVPLVWLLVNATKDQGDLFSTFGLWFGSDFNLWQNIVDTLTYRDVQERRELIRKRLEARNKRG